MNPFILWAVYTIPEPEQQPGLEQQPERVCSSGGFEVGRVLEPEPGQLERGGVGRPDERGPGQPDERGPEPTDERARYSVGGLGKWFECESVGGRAAAGRAARDEAGGWRLVAGRVVEPVRNDWVLPPESLLDAGEFFGWRFWFDAGRLDGWAVVAPQALGDRNSVWVSGVRPR